MNIPDEIINSICEIGRDLLRCKTAMGDDEFDKRCALWMVQGVEEMRYKGRPTPPSEIIEYRKLRNIDRNHRMNEAFWKQAHIYAFVKSDSEIKNINSANLYWLRWIEEKIDRNEKVSMMIRSHGGTPIR